MNEMPPRKHQPWCGDVTIGRSPDRCTCDEVPIGEWRWLESTRRLQETSFGVDYATLTGEKLADYLLVNAYFLADELHEATTEVQLKPWAKNRGDLNREAFIDELVDLTHFLGNALVAVGATDEEFWYRYQGKQNRNAVRQRHGYDAKASKCPDCRRELDKPKALIRMAVMKSVKGDQMAVIRCAGCSHRLGVQLPGDNDVTWDAGVDVPGLSEASFTDG